MTVPGGQRAAWTQQAEELREALRRTLARYDIRGPHPWHIADVIVALPEVQALLGGAPAGDAAEGAACAKCGSTARVRSGDEIRCPWCLTGARS